MILQWIYSDGEVELPSENMMEIFFVANKFIIPKLQEISGNFPMNFIVNL